MVQYWTAQVTREGGNLIAGLGRVLLTPKANGEVQAGREQDLVTVGVAPDENGLVYVAVINVVGGDE